MLINRASLSKTVDAIHAAHFDGRTLPAVERRQAARWIAGRQGLPGARHLRSMRDGEHQWRRFPFWYTVLALSEMDHAEARIELKYAAPALEREATRATPSSVYARRRHELAVRTLNGL
jgi:hypothetical protein